MSRFRRGDEAPPVTGIAPYIYMAYSTYDD
jgi:hypothetical protein